MTEVGAVIKKAREKSGLTQTKLGGLLKVAPQFLNQVEMGKTPLPLNRSRKLIKILLVTKEILWDAYMKDYSRKILKELNKGH